MNEENKNLQSEKKNDDENVGYLGILAIQILIPAVIFHFSIPSIVHTYLFGIGIALFAYAAPAASVDKYPNFFRFCFYLACVQIVLTDVYLLWKLSTFLAFFSLFHMVFYAAGMVFIGYFLCDLIRIKKRYEQYLRGELKEDEDKSV